MPRQLLRKTCSFPACSSSAKKSETPSITVLGLGPWYSRRPSDFLLVKLRERLVFSQDSKPRWSAQPLRKEASSFSQFGPMLAPVPLHWHGSALQLAACCSAGQPHSA